MTILNSLFEFEFNKIQIIDQSLIVQPTAEDEIILWDDSILDSLEAQQLDISPRVKLFPYNRGVIVLREIIQRETNT